MVLMPQPDLCPPQKCAVSLVLAFPVCLLTPSRIQRKSPFLSAELDRESECAHAVSFTQQEERNCIICREMKLKIIMLTKISQTQNMKFSLPEVTYTP